VHSPGNRNSGVERVAEHLTAAVRRYWEREIVSCFPPQRNSHEILHGVRYFVAEALVVQIRRLINLGVG